MKAKDLKNSILQMAVQGKLVPQDPNDEPASVLLERIREERAKLIKEKKIKAPKGGESVIYRSSDGSYYEKRGNGVPVCIDDEIPFKIPESWEWVRMESLSFAIRYGFTQSASTSGNAKFLRITDIQNGTVDWSGVPYVTVTDSELDKYQLFLNDIVIARTGGTVGKAFVLADDPEPSVFASYLIRIKPIDKSVVKYVEAYLDCPFYWQQLISAAQGTGQPNVNAQSLGSLLLPIPPLDEQNRLIERIKYLMPFVTQYGSLEDERERLDTELPERLRKSILQIAVQGKLVPQDPADESAAILLERIRKERATLVKQKKLKAPKGGESVIYRGSDGGYYEKRGNGEPVCIDDEIPFEIPESWEWVRASSIGQIVGGGTPKTTASDYWTDNDGGIPWLTPADMKHIDGIYVSHGERYITEDGLRSSSAQLLPVNSVLMSSRAPIGYLAIASCELATNQGFKSIVPDADEMAEFIFWSLEALMDGIKKRSSGTTFKEISGLEFGKTLMPIPPRGEQVRIVEALESSFTSL